MQIRTRTVVGAGVIAAVVLAGGVSYYASGSPDGLAKVGILFGFNETEHATAGGPFAGYATAGVGGDWLSGAIAGVVGVLVTFVVAGGLFLAVRGRRTRVAQDGGSAGSHGDTSD